MKLVEDNMILRGLDFAVIFFMLMVAVSVNTGLRLWLEPYWAIKQRASVMETLAAGPKPQILTEKMDDLNRDVERLRISQDAFSTSLNKTQELVTTLSLEVDSRLGWRKQVTADLQKINKRLNELNFH